MTDFLVTFGFSFTVITLPIWAGCIVLGICGWLSDHVTIGGPRR